ncbi:MAG TPA: aspartate carbamoyltransferase [Ruminococcaceae bacterium]|nr:aspartate carbamoyltransferase [Oscillospiraceae bacterium]HCM23662.1 aspartate carbamoyltransferase [Oscillospiraceae bacterium]
MLQLNHMIDLDQLTVSQLKELINLADCIRKNPWAYSESCRGKIMATLFYEPSTRTKMSFQTAMYRLGGEVVGFDNPENTSVSKGESLKDTITVVSGYTDLIVMRNPHEGAAAAAAIYSKVPIINAGDGGHMHPSQTLTDLVTLYNEKGRLDHLCIGLCGDLKYGRTVHSLIKTMTRFEGNSFILISTPELALPQYVKDVIDAAGCKYAEASSLEEALPKLDVLYMTRIQQERFANRKQYEEQKSIYVLNAKKLEAAKPNLRILHPLPRVDEIAEEVDRDPRATYFRQTVYGMYARMALILTILQSNRIKPDVSRLGSIYPYKCSNPNCITQTEPYLPHLFTEAGDMLVCSYCDGRMHIKRQ